MALQSMPLLFTYVASIANYNHSMGYGIYDNIVVTAKTTNWN